MTTHMINELTTGAIDCPEIKCGFIGEVGCGYPLHGKKQALDINAQIYLLKLKIKLIIILDFERNSVVASAFAQEQTQAPVGFHPGLSFENTLHCK